MWLATAATAELRTDRHARGQSRTQTR